MQHDAFVGAVKAIYGTYRHAGCIRAVHTGHRDGALTRFAIIEGNHTTAIHAPRDVVFLFTGGHAAIAFNATLSITEKFHSGHF
jgi:hypothetical protein